jgi:hypothetical protein
MATWRRDENDGGGDGRAGGDGHRLQFRPRHRAGSISGRHRRHRRLRSGVAQNFEDGGRLVARLAASAARCVAERWVAIVDPAILRAAGLAPEAMVDVTLERLAEVTTLDRPRAEALAGSFTVCGVDHTAAFLDSLLLTSQITPTQRVCLAEAIPAGLIGAITVSVLVDAALDPALSTQYQKALDACPPT